MRLSPLQHNVARLRVFLGLGQKEFAELAGCKPVTIQSVELVKRKLKLSEDLAQRIATATGIARKWILENDLKAEMMAADGTLYTKRHFEVAQSLKDKALGHPSAWDFDSYALAFYGRLGGVLLHLLEHPAQAELVYWKVNKFLNEIEKEHGVFSTTEPVQPSPMIGPYASQAEVEYGTRFAFQLIERNRSKEWQACKQAMKQIANEGREMVHDGARMEERIAIEQAKAAAFMQKSGKPNSKKLQTS